MKIIHLFSLTLLVISSSISAQTASINWENCHYQGQIQQNKPHGTGVLTCADGRIYTGQFTHGLFHGRGQYIVPDAPALFIAPFGLRSGQIKNMVLIGTFKNGIADGIFQAHKNGQHILNMEFEQGMIKSVTTPKTKKQEKK